MVHLFSRLRSGTSLAVMSAAIVAAPAMAQNQAANPATQAAPQSASDVENVDEIIVTAQFRSQKLQDTPLAISAFSAASLEARGQTSVSEIAQQAPNVTLNNQGASFGPSLAASIRGVGQFDFNPALEPGVGFYVDDVYYATLTGSIVDLLDLDRVEILRGPQGTLAGKNSIGGAIKLYSLLPTGSNTGYISATYGQRNRLDLRGSFDARLAENLAMRLAGVTKRQDGYVNRIDYGCAFPTSGVPRVLSAGTDCVIDKQGEVNYQAVRGSLRWEGTPGLDVVLSGDFTSENRTGAPGVLTDLNFQGNFARVSDLPPTFNFQNFVVPKGGYYTYATFNSPARSLGPFSVTELNVPNRVKYKGGGASLNLTYELTDTMSLKSITAYRGYTTSFGSDDDGSPLGFATTLNDLDFWSVSQELRLNGSIGANKAFEYTLGGFYQDQKSTTSVTTQVGFAPVPLGFTAINEPVDASTKAVFAQGTWHATDELNITGGIRYTKEKKDYTFFRFQKDGSFSPLVSGTNGQTSTFNGDNVDYRVAIDYRWSDEIMTYAQFSTGFKGGGVNPRPQSSAQVVSFDPETLTSWELGFKSDLFDRKLRLNASAFYSKYKDLIVTLNTCPPNLAPIQPCFVPANSGTADIKGFEVEATLRPFDGLTIDGAVSYVDFQYKSLSALAIVSGITLNDKPVNTPEWKYSIGVQYDLPLGADWRLSPRFDGAYQSEIFSRANNLPRNRTDGYFLANGRLTLNNNASDLAFTFEVRNLFNKYYYAGIFDIANGFVSATPARPREWAVTVRKGF